MNFELVKSAKVTIKSDSAEAAFAKLIAIWRSHSGSANRRLAGVKKVDEMSDDFAAVVCATQTEGVEDIHVSRFIPKADLFSFRAFEASSISGSLSADFVPCVLDGGRHPHVPFSYRIAVEVLQKSDGENECELQMYSTNKQESNWLSTVAFPILLRWLENMDLEKKNDNETHRLVDVDQFTSTYRFVKENWGRHIAANWKERTSAQKFVFEDCAIASYLVELWRSRQQRALRFCDVGCGNGLLVYLLNKLQIEGYGVDVRRRNIWKELEGADLREMALNPETDSLPNANFLIGNHSDELTPWIPVLAARTQSNFFLLPCCPFDFYGRYNKRRGGGDESSAYASYLTYVRSICSRLGYTVEEDRLKIPSTKRRCFVCTVPGDGLHTKNVETEIGHLLKPFEGSGFVARKKREPVRNCSQLSADVRKRVTKKIFDYLLSLDGDCGPQNQGSWRRGGSCSVAEASRLLADDNAFLKDSDGGVQTFLKNQHQLFKVSAGRVSIRNWEAEGRRVVEGKTKTSECLFQSHHPQGCPLLAELCAYKHVHSN